MEVDTLAVLSLLVLLFALYAVGVARRRAERRAEEERARARARRRSVPAVSANVRGLPTGATDLWAEETGASAQRKDRVA